MDLKSPEVHEVELLAKQDDFSEKKSRKGWVRLLHGPKDTQCSLDTGHTCIRSMASSWKLADGPTVHKHGWKPLTLGAPVLFSFTFASFILAVIIEVLAQQSQQRGGLALSAAADDIPTYAKFGYLFLPTIVAVIYSLLWSWIDLDVKRIQPWLEMSKPAGAKAEHSIFLDYPYDFIAFAPFRAMRRR